jgi:hypothetical protein
MILWAIIKPYLEKLAQSAFSMIKIWAWVITLFGLYTIISGTMWYKSIEENAQLKIKLSENQGKIQTLVEQQNQIELENENLLAKIYFVSLRIDSLNRLLSKGLKKDENIRINNLIQSDGKAIELFTKRYGKGSALRYKPIRVDKDTNAQGNQRQR